MAPRAIIGVNGARCYPCTEGFIGSSVGWAYRVGIGQGSAGGKTNIQNITVIIIGKDPFGRVRQYNGAQ